MWRDLCGPVSTLASLWLWLTRVNILYGKKKNETGCERRTSRYVITQALWLFETETFYNAKVMWGHVQDCRAQVLAQHDAAQASYSKHTVHLTRRSAQTTWFASNSWCSCLSGFTTSRKIKAGWEIVFISFCSLWQKVKRLLWGANGENNAAFKTFNSSEYLMQLCTIIVLCWTINTVKRQPDLILSTAYNPQMWSTRHS